MNLFTMPSHDKIHNEVVNEIYLSFFLSPFSFNNIYVIMKKYIILAFSAVVLSVGLSSCGIYGKFKSKTDESVDTLKIPSYTDIFTDKYLLSLIDTAMASNLDLKIAHENVEQAKAVLLGAKLAYLPSIYAAPSVTYGTNVGGMQPSLSYGFGQASWELDIFGRTTNKKRIANASKKEMEDYEQAARVELISSVATTYYTLLMIDAQIETTDEAVVNRAEAVETMKSMKIAGMTDEAAVAQFEASYYSAVAQSKELRLSRIKAENAMRLLLCKDELTIDRDGLYSSVINGNNIDAVNLQVLRVRPDVKAVEHQLERAFYSMNLARANCCPSISISGNIGWNGGLIFSAVGSLLQPIFNSGRNIAEVQSSKHALRATEYAYSNVLFKAGKEVNDALAAKKSYRSQQPDYENQVNSLARAYDATFTKMSLGKGTYLEVLTAQKDLLVAQMSAIGNAASILMADVDL